MWSAAIFDTATGRIAQPIDIPSLSWALTVSGCSARTTRDEGGEGLGESTGSGLSLPWTAVPGSDRSEKCRAIASYRRGIALMWDGAPVVAGAIGERTDTASDASFSLLSPMELLASRYLATEGRFGAAKGSKTRDEISYKGLSLRAIAADIVRRCTDLKPGGYLPIDLPFLDESGSHQRTYHGWNVANNAAQKLLDEISSVDGGPDIQFRPYLADESHLRWRMEAGSDQEPALKGGSPTPTVRCVQGGSGGSAYNVTVAWQGPVMRVYGTGDGQDAGTLCHLSQDLGLSTSADPWPLMEATASDSDWSTADLVRRHADAALYDLSAPLAQLSCSVQAADPANPVRPGQVWPGQRVDLELGGFPSLPDGVYALRLMEMAGSLGGEVTLTFDPIEDPWIYGVPR